MAVSDFDRLFFEREKVTVKCALTSGIRDYFAVFEREKVTVKCALTSGIRDYFAGEMSLVRA
jgi:hypothetical protein